MLNWMAKKMRPKSHYIESQSVSPREITLRPACAYRYEPVPNGLPDIRLTSLSAGLIWVLSLDLLLCSQIGNLSPRPFHFRRWWRTLFKIDSESVKRVCHLRTGSVLILQAIVICIPHGIESLGSLTALIVLELNQRLGDWSEPSLFASLRQANKLNATLGRLTTWT